MTNTPSVAIIGGGIFGVSCALELSASFPVTLFEKSDHLLAGATYANHNRHHYGFHYPRSPETARQCLESREGFERIYGDILDFNFSNYYCVARDNTKTSPEKYLAFCRENHLQIEEAWPPEGALDRSKIALCLRVREGVYDIAKLRALVTARLAQDPHVSVRQSHEVIGGRMADDGRKVLQIRSGQKVEEQAFDIVISATYGSANAFCRWFGFAPQEYQFNLQELDVIELPLAERIGMTIQDGEFPSFIPIANSRRYLLAHVITSQLVREISTQSVPLLARAGYVESNWEGVLKSSAAYFPILNRATYIKSLFVDRVVDAARSQDDARLSEIRAFGHGCWSIFSAKVITCISTAAKLHRLVQEAPR